MASADPKHGRWILPLIIVAMVILTYTFVTRIDPATRPEGVTTEPEPPFPTDPTAATTTLPPTLASFLVTMDIFENQAQSFRSEVDRINNAWESRTEEFAPTRTAFLSLKDSISQWETDVAQVGDVPPELAAGHVELVLQAADLAPKIEDIVAGLEAPDDGTLRRTAVAEFTAETDDVTAAIDAIRATATASVEPAEGEETTTTEG